MSHVIEPDLIFGRDDFSLVRVEKHQILNNIHGATILQKSEQSIVYMVEYSYTTESSDPSVVEKKAIIKVFTYDRFDYLKQYDRCANIQKVLDAIINDKRSSYQLNDQIVDDLLKEHRVTLDEGDGFNNEKRRTIFKMLDNKGSSELAEREYNLANSLKEELGGKRGIIGELCPEFIFEYEYDKKNNPNVIISDTELNIVPYNMHPAIFKHYHITGATVDRLIRGERQVDPVISQIFSIIHCIHEAGFYHRDIKPQNFVISRTRGRAPHKIHLIDFGLSLREDELRTDEVFYVDSTIPYLSPFMISAEDLGTRTRTQQRKILIANDYWGAICTIIYHLYNIPWWKYTAFSSVAKGNITTMYRTPTNQIILPAKQPTDPIFKIFKRFFYHMLPPPPSGGPPRGRTVTEYIKMIKSIMFPPHNVRQLGAMRGRKKRTKRKNQSSTIKSRTRKPKTKKKRTKKRTKKKHQTRRK